MHPPTPTDEALLNEDESVPPDFYAGLNYNESWAARYIGSKRTKPSDFFSYNDIPEGKLVHGNIKEMRAKPQLLLQDASFYRVSPSDSENGITEEAMKKLFTFERGLSDDEVARLTREVQARIRHRAVAQNAALAAIYKYNQHQVVMMLSQPGAKDGVYVTDSGKTVQKYEILEDGTVIMGPVITVIPRYAHVERPMEASWRRELEEGAPHIPREVKQQEEILEMGDTRFVFHRIDANHPGGFILAGIKEEQGDNVHPRSTLEGHRELEKNLGIPVHTIYLKAPFYHMDTTGILRTDGKFFTNRDCFMPESWEKIRELFGDENIVEMPMEDMRAFLGNGTCFGHDIYTSDAISDESAKKLAEGGYNVFLTPIDALMISGGGHRCMSSWHHFFEENGYIVEPPAGGPGHIYKLKINYDLPDIAYSHPIPGQEETNFPFTLVEIVDGQEIEIAKLPGCGANLNINPATQSLYQETSPGMTFR